MPSLLSQLSQALQSSLPLLVCCDVNLKTVLCGCKEQLIKYAGSCMVTQLRQRHCCLDVSLQLSSQLLLVASWTLCRRVGVPEAKRLMQQCSLAHLHQSFDTCMSPNDGSVHRAHVRCANSLIQVGASRVNVTLDFRVQGKEQIQRQGVL